MKTTALALMCLLALSPLKAQVIDLGTWSMFEMSYVTGEGTQTFTEEMMKSEGALTEIYFFAEGKVKQTSNMSGSGTLDTYEGTWKTNGNELIITLRLGDQEVDVDYTWEMSEDVLILTRTAPDGSLKIVAYYRKKE